MPIDPETGLVVSYHFLWAREYRTGEEEGRKARPACVVIPLGRQGNEVVLFPLTTRAPEAGRLAVRVPEMERRRLRLRGSGPAWVLLDECNRDVLPGSFYLEPITLEPLNFAYGKFSRAFIGQLLQTLAGAIRDRRLRLVPRR